MGEALKLLMRNSAVASLMIVFVFIIRYIFKDKLNMKLQYALWLIVAVRLIIPLNFQWTIESRYSIPQLQIFEFISDFGGVPSQEGIINNPLAYKSTENILRTENYQSKDYQNTVLKALFIAWLLGTFSVFIIFIRRYALFRRNITKDLIPCSFLDSAYNEAAIAVGLKQYIPVYVSLYLNSPCIIGTFNPVIVLTEKIILDAKATKFALMHEMIHYKQKDNMIKLLGNLVCALYWFNPLVWLAAKAVGEDAELSCDSSLLQKISAKERYDYCLTLLSVADTSNQMIMAMSSGGKKMKKRIDRILKPQQRPTTGVIAALICLSLGLVSFVNINVNAKSNTIHLLTENAIDVGPTEITLGSIYEVYQLLNALPNPNDNYKINTITINNEDYFKLLNLNYEFSHKDSIGGLSEYNISNIGNNALFLFSSISDLKEIRISYIDKQANSIVRNVKAPITFNYQRSQIIEKAGEKSITPQIDHSFWESWGGNNTISIYGHSEILSHMGIEENEYTKSSTMTERIFLILGDYNDTWQSHNSTVYMYSSNPMNNDWPNFTISTDEFGNLKSHGIILSKENKERNH